MVSDARKRRRLTSEERLQRSRERNRMHAKKTRQRKKMQMEALQARIDALKAEFAALKQILDERYTAYILLVMSGASEKGDGNSLPPGEGTNGGAADGEGPLSVSRLASISLAEILGVDRLPEEEPDECPQKRMRRRGKYTPAERDHIRRERNRMHAKRTRDRKKLFLEESQKVIERMENENARLRSFLVRNGMLNESNMVPIPPPAVIPDILNDEHFGLHKNEDSEDEDHSDGSSGSGSASGAGSGIKQELPAPMVTSSA